MFYEGDLQSGIQKALQERRLVGCFVHNDGPRSLEWEKSWLADIELQSTLADKVILLRIRDGSQEAGFLSAFCAIPSIPSLLMIENGQLTAKLTADLTEEDFKAALQDAVAGSESGAASTTTVATAHSQTPISVDEAATDPSNESSSGLHMDDQVRSMYDERRTRLEADKSAKEAAEKAARKARADVRKAETETGTSSSGRRSSQSAQANQVRKAQQEARLERERILQKIENDKQERRDREREHRRQRSESETHTPQHVSSNSTGSAGSLGRSSNVRECALQVRLFDGSTIRQRFSAWKTIRTHVRPWIDKERKGDDTPYTFRQVLVPLPNRVIEIAEEDEDLETLGLCPSATLIMVPVQGYTNAYETPGNAVAKGVSTGYNIVSEGVGLLGSAIGSLFGYGARDSASAGESTRSSTEGRRSSEDQHHLYTGNGINVEPRRELKREDSWG